MGMVQYSAATTLSVNDLATLSPSRADREPYPRRLLAIGLAGSAAIGDYELALDIEGREVSRFKNTKGGASTHPNRDDLQPVGVLVPANARMELRVITVPTTNTGTGYLITQP